MMLQQVIKPLNVTVMGVHTPTHAALPVTCVHAYMVTFTATNPCRGLLYKRHNASDIIVPRHVHQSFTRSRGTGVNGPEKQLAREEEIDKK